MRVLIHRRRATFFSNVHKYTIYAPVLLLVFARDMPIKRGEFFLFFFSKRVSRFREDKSLGNRVYENFIFAFRVRGKVQVDNGRNWSDVVFSLEFFSFWFLRVDLVLYMAIGEWRRIWYKIFSTPGDVSLVIN